MDAVLAGLYQREAVVARIYMKEECRKRLYHPVAHTKAQQVAIERKDRLDILNGEHRVPHAERTRAEPRNRAPGLESLNGTLRTVKSLEPRADGIFEDDQI